MEEIFLDIAATSGTSFRLGNITAPSVSALRSADVARDMIILGTISLNIAAPGLFDRMEATRSPKLMAIIFDYAHEVAPRVEGEDSVIDVAALGKHVGFMRDTFGDVEVSPDFVTRLGQVAQIQVNLEKLAERPAPGADGETA